MVTMILPSATPRWSSSDTLYVCMYAPSGQLRGGGSSKISPLSTSLAGGDGVQNQLREPRDGIRAVGHAAFK